MGESATKPVVRGRSALPLARTFERVARSEVTLAFYVGLAVSVVFNLPIVLRPSSMVTGDLGDPLLQTWQLAWLRRFVSEGGDLWTSNQFYPAVDSLAFSDSLLGYLPLSLLGDGPETAVLRYNVAFVLAFAIAFAGGYLLLRQLGSNWQGAALAGAVLAWSPWRLTHVHHLNLLSIGGIALAFCALARGHGFSLRGRRDPAPLWIFAGWVVAAWQVTIGFALGITFVYVMALAGIAIAVFVWRQRPGLRTIIANAWGIAVFLVVTLLMVAPYFRVLDRYGFGRTWREIELFSPPPSGLLTTTWDSWLWQATSLADSSSIPHDGILEKLLFPGLFVLVFGVVGLFLSAWGRTTRIVLAALVVVPAVLALGAGFLDGALYRVMWDLVPGWDAMRAPGRLILWAILPLIVLAAGAVTELGRQLVIRTQLRSRTIAVLLLVPALGALLEGVPRWSHVPTPAVPAGVQRVFTQTQEPLLMLPMDTYDEFTYLLWSTEGFPKMANGNSGNFPPQYREIAAATTNFPDQRSLQALKSHGIYKIVVVKSRPEGADIAARPVGGLPLERVETDDVVEYTITG
ncbi:hypothetical protein [Lentzea cavernae]|uniref:Glycosyltransferase RgtA/B/C/D-like domain-containing protein n=1 Tax=Lentzea cavernae TaxID=2020703 RepID=A0ABQ3ML99_9PSEU|nr:hypothetical protein [Lentzea cavernae]GHH48753.1 hypothetical protein GCM10017774_55060 [Lentzea cavernae]